MNPRTNTINAFIVLITSLSITGKYGASTWCSSNISLPVVLDSVTMVMHLPSDLVDTIISQFSAIDDTGYFESHLRGLRLAYNTSEQLPKFGFGDSNGSVIHVPRSEVIRTITGDYPDSPFDLGIRAVNISTYLLGDTFLRSAYVVYDIDDKQIAIAQTNFEAPGSEVHEIPSGLWHSFVVRPGQWRYSSATKPFHHHPGILERHNSNAARYYGDHRGNA
jgi:hypothetical protein